MARAALAAARRHSTRILPQHAKNNLRITPMNRSVSFSVQSASLPEALTHLARTAGVSVMLDHVGPVPSKRLSLSVDNAPLHDILDIIADAFGLRWHRHGVVYVLR